MSKSKSQRASVDLRSMLGGEEFEFTVDESHEHLAKSDFAKCKKFGLKLDGSLSAYQLVNEAGILRGHGRIEIGDHMALLNGFCAHESELIPMRCVVFRAKKNEMIGKKPVVVLIFIDFPTEGEHEHSTGEAKASYHRGTYVHASH